MIEFNRQKLKNAFYIRGYNLRDASEKLGKSRDYLSNCLHTKKINEKVVYDIEKIFDIEPEEYIGNGPEVRKTIFDEFLEKMYETIYEATYTAVKKAWEDD